jgi:hypothetical protein
MLKEQLHRIKNAAIYFAMIGIIGSYIIFSMSIDLEIFSDNIVSIDNLRFEMFGVFITIQLVLFFAKLVVNREHGLINLENLLLLVLFALEIAIVYSFIMNGAEELYGIGTHVAIIIVEVIKSFVMLTYAVTNLMENFYIKDKNKFFQNNLIGVSND